VPWPEMTVDSDKAEFIEAVRGTAARGNSPGEQD